MHWWSFREISGYAPVVSAWAVKMHAAPPLAWSVVQAVATSVGTTPSCATWNSIACGSPDVFGS